MRISILGATGLVGRETVRLCRLAWPGATLYLYASRDQELELDGNRLPVRAASTLDTTTAPSGDLALVALDDDHSARYVPRLLALGHRVVDKSNTYRADPTVPLVVAGVDCAAVAADVRLCANPNCTTIPLCLALAPLHRAFGLTRVTVATYQAISGAGQLTLDQFLAASREGFAAQDRLGLPFDPLGYAGNTVPHHGKTDASGFAAEERKLVAESRRILALPDLAIGAQCARVPVAVGHYLHVWLELAQPTTQAELEHRLGASATAPFVRCYPGSTGDSLSALAAIHDRDRALVGRLRADPRCSPGHGFCLTVVGDNLRLGAATNGVRVASRWFPVAVPELQAPGWSTTA